MNGPPPDAATLTPGTANLADAVVAAGWAPVARGGLVRVVDAREVAAEEATAAADRAALLAIVGDGEGADRAYDEGATHVLIGEPTRQAVARALRFAGRHARRLRGRGRRHGDLGDAGPVDAALASVAAATLAEIALTRFDVVNQAFGRAGGDALLTATRDRIAALLPAGSTIERGEGARFVVALVEPAAVAERMLREIDAALARPFETRDAETSLGARIGAAHRATGEPVEALRRRAGEALAAASANDGVTLRIAPATHVTPAQGLAADLHRAIERREIDVLFQPQVSLGDGAITGVEALARWEHPEHGVLGAATLFAAADRAALDLALSEHIQAIALERCAAWPAALARLRLSVNVTAGDVAREDFAERFLGRVAASGVDPRRVTAEVTETGLIADLAGAAARLALLREAGIAVALDDFGTGYSSLGYLKALPLDYLKIDRSLAQDIAGSAHDRVVVRGVIAIAEGLGLATIAEGVETEAQRDALAAEGVTTYQGFLCAGPLDEAQLATLIEEWRA